MIDIYVGIDPSINSTGITIITYEDELEKDIQFYIIKPNKLSKKESNINLENFSYILYNKVDISIYKNDNYISELLKTINMITLIDTIYDTIINYISKYDNAKVNILIEGISYGSSIRTKSIFDLAGINYMIRYKFISNNHNIIIATPSNIKKYATGNGNANKTTITTMFTTLFPEMSIISKLDDIADSYFMACLSKKLNDNK